jgi:hypothetical protein
VLSWSANSEDSFVWRASSVTPIVRGDRLYVMGQVAEIDPATGQLKPWR